MKRFKERRLCEGDPTQGLTLGARGTPAFFVNGRFLSGAQPVAAFEREIDEEMTNLVASGVSRADVYERTIASGPLKPE